MNVVVYEKCAVPAGYGGSSCTVVSRLAEAAIVHTL